MDFLGVCALVYFMVHVGETIYHSDRLPQRMYVFRAVIAALIFCLGGWCIGFFPF